jgi:hypothetical protein
MALFLALAFLPVREIPTDYCSVVEVNHVIDAAGGIGLEQTIWWDVTPDGYQVLAWRMLASTGYPTVERGRYVVTWRDSCSGGRIRRIVAASWFETWTRYDPEIADREWWPVDKRRRLAE